MGREGDDGFTKVIQFLPHPKKETQRKPSGPSLPPAGPILIELFTFIDLNIHFVCILG